MLSRRKFHKHIASFSGLTGLGCFAKDVRAVPASENTNRLITIFLAGGNDGLNTVVPATDPLYQRFRNTLALRSADAFPLEDDLFLHPAMRALMPLWESGQLAIQQGVGYPGHSRSHFVSASSWFEGRPRETANTFDGWIARALDPLQRNARSPLAYSIATTDTPELFRGRVTRTGSLPQVSPAEASELSKQLQLNLDDSPKTESEALVAQICRDASRTLQHNFESKTPVAGFPKSVFGERLRQMAQVIESFPEVKALHTFHDGYDTHSEQRGTHAELLRELSTGLAALHGFLLSQGLIDSTLVMVFSEFGRRVKENESAGTDHGAAGPVILLGGGLSGGLGGSRPNLEKLDQGDVAITTDVRDMYRRITPWLTQRNPQRLRFED